MDMQTEKWFSQIQLSGVGQPINTQGSLSQIIGVFLKTLKSTRPRKLADGIEIKLLIRETPFPDSKDNSTSILDLAIQLESQLDLSNETTGPNPDETFEEFLSRLISTGMIPSAAEMIACDWFNRQPDPDLLNWMADSKAIRFRQLNSVQLEFEKALPSEYAELKIYVTQTYPKFCRNITFRTA